MGGSLKPSHVRNSNHHYFLVFKLFLLICNTQSTKQPLWTRFHYYSLWTAGETEAPRNQVDLKPFNTIKWEEQTSPFLNHRSHQRGITLASIYLVQFAPILLGSLYFPSFHSSVVFFSHSLFWGIKPNYSHFHPRCLPTSLKLSAKTHFLSQELIKVFFFLFALDKGKFLLKKNYCESCEDNKVYCLQNFLQSSWQL